MMRVGEYVKRVKRYTDLRNPIDREIVGIPLAQWPAIAEGNGYPYSPGDEGRYTFWYRDLLRFLRRKALNEGVVYLPDGEEIQVAVTKFPKNTLDKK